MTDIEISVYLDSKSLEELVDFINDCGTSQDLSTVKKVDDKDWWNKIGSYLEGWSFKQMLKECPEPKNAIYFSFDQENTKLQYFRSKRDLLKVYKGFLEDELSCIDLDPDMD